MLGLTSLALKRLHNVRNSYFPLLPFHLIRLHLRFQVPFRLAGRRRSGPSSGQPAVDGHRLRSYVVAVRSAVKPREWSQQSVPEPDGIGVDAEQRREQHG